MSFEASQVPIYINCRDRVTGLRQLVAWLEAAGYERIVMIDNASNYEPLLDYYEQTPHQVMRLKQNLGSRSIWIRDGELLKQWFVFTDPDVVPIDECPGDVVERLHGIMLAHGRHKAGLGLYLEDLPAEFDPDLLEWERSLVARHRELAPGVYDSMVDTTFALYRPLTYHNLPALRTDFPYQVRHLPWYELGELSYEDRHYLNRAIKGPLGTSWGHSRIRR